MRVVELALPAAPPSSAGPAFGFTAETREELRIVVAGTPGPQGSKRHVGKGRMIESSRKVKPWRVAVATAAAGLIATLGPDWKPLDVPLRVRMVFTLRRPLRPKASRPDRTPDLSKLLRSTEDALTGLVWKDDARIVEYERAAKVYAGSDDPEALDEPGAFIVITREYR